MQLKSVKTTADLPFKGIELVKVDGRVDEVIIGGKLHIKAGSYGGMQVLVATQGEDAKRIKITAEIEGFATVTEYVDGDYEANQRVSDLERRGATVKRESVAVVIDDAGKVVSEGVTAVAQTADDFIPF